MEHQVEMIVITAINKASYKYKLVIDLIQELNI